MRLNFLCAASTHFCFSPPFMVSHFFSAAMYSWSWFACSGADFTDVGSPGWFSDARGGSSVGRDLSAAPDNPLARINAVAPAVNAYSSLFMGPSLYGMKTWSMRSVHDASTNLVRPARVKFRRSVSPIGDDIKK